MERDNNDNTRVLFVTYAYTVKPKPGISATMLDPEKPEEYDIIEFHGAVYKRNSPEFPSWFDKKPTIQQLWKDL